MAQYNQIGDSTSTGAQPTEQDPSDAKRQGIRTVINLRLLDETAVLNAHRTTKHGMYYVNVQVDEATLSPSSIAHFDEVLQPNEDTHLLHCATGASAAMLLALTHTRQKSWTVECTLQEAEAFGCNLQNHADITNFVKQVTAKRS